MSRGWSIECSIYYSELPKKLKSCRLGERRGFFLQEGAEKAEVEDAVTEDAVTEDAVTEDAVTEDAVTEEVVTEEVVTEEVVTEEVGDWGFRAQGIGGAGD